MVSIIPGIEALAPERTETSSGFSLSPNFLPRDLLHFVDVGHDLGLNVGD